MKTQDNRGTAQPYALVIRTKSIAWGFDPEYAGKNTGLIWEESTYLYEDFEQFKVDIIEYGYDTLLEEINEENVCSFYDLENSVIDLSDYEFTITGYQIQQTADSSEGTYQGNLFLTEKAAFQYIKNNRHNLNEPDTYGIHLYRNPEMEKLYKIIHKISDALKASK